MTKLFEKLANEPQVRADAPPANGEIIDKSNIVGAVCKYLGTQYVTDKRTPKHIFSIPSAPGSKEPMHFALWGDAQLNSLLRKVKPGEFVGMIYDGKKPDGNGNEVHTWRLSLITSKGQDFADLIAEAEICYKGIRQAVVLAKHERAANFGRGRAEDAPPPLTDEDFGGW